jgi:hypothetical protein
VGQALGRIGGGGPSNLSTALSDLDTVATPLLALTNPFSITIGERRYSLPAGLLNAILGGNYTGVYLQRHLKPPGSNRPGASEAQEPMQILVFSHQWRTMRLNMKWLSPSHLEVVYGPSSRPWDHVEVDFQVVKIAGIDVSLQKLNNSSAEAHQ